MIGKIYSSVVPYYNRDKNVNAFKKRPVLIIAGPRNNDYTVLPISTVSIRANLDAEYDIEIEPEKYPELGLKKICYVRVHKQTTVHQASLTTVIGDMKKDYGELYLRILRKLEEYNKRIIDEAL
ncbi:MAG: type II toxin-antitoxin system PemK/MazF family toxin [Muribaculaceae bacterium]|nr:type II toxin-antitoxin system PemK/MazF family toxin [Roseburia sp.]MCM1432026.1 type II toxin-antitoxin system PemK/MazF family toxin [Muribaculaceae bacterium]MCM1493721.1 type II toxin-antitoxin system PemK/MazF family toxin [Muribaculaceae bacterium]